MRLVGYAFDQIWKYLELDDGFNQMKDVSILILSSLPLKVENGGEETTNGRLQLSRRQNAERMVAETRTNGLDDRFVIERKRLGGI